MIYKDVRYYLEKAFLPYIGVKTLDCIFPYVLKGNDFNDKDAEQIADGIRQTNTLRSLNLSQNAFQERGGEDIAAALGEAGFD